MSLDLENKQERLDSRLSVVENEITNIRDEIHDVSRGIDDLSNKLGTVGKRDWVAFWGAATVIVMIVIALGTALYTPLNWRIQNNESIIRQLSDTQNQMSKDLSNYQLQILKTTADNRALVEEVSMASKARHQDIETKLRWLSDCQNLRDREIGTWINMVWSDSHEGKPIPFLNLPSIGPGANVTSVQVDSLDSTTPPTSIR